MKTPTSESVKTVVKAATEPEGKSLKVRMKICGVGGRSLGIVTGVIIVLTIALCLGLGVGLKKNNGDSDDRWETLPCYHSPGY